MKRLGTYDLFETVGAGAMSMVYRAVDSATGRTAAVKVLHPHLGEAGNVARFEREVHVLSTLKHPNIVELYSFSNGEGGEYFSVLEYVEGQSVKDILAREKEVQPDLAAMIVLELAKALAAAHAKGIIHRDLKPENLLVRKDGVLKISDFGLAYLWEGTDLTAPGTWIGSPAFMSPEQIRGEKPSPVMDLFSLGILFYLMLTSELPFKGKSRRETFDQILHGTPPAPRKLMPHIPAVLSDLCLALLGKGGGGRILSADDVILRLEEYLATVGLSDYEPLLRKFLSNPKAHRDEIRRELANAYLRLGAQALEKQDTARVLELFRNILVLTGVTSASGAAPEEVLPTQKVTLRKGGRRAWLLAGLLTATALAAWLTTTLFP